VRNECRDHFSLLICFFINAIINQCQFLFFIIALIKKYVFLTCLKDTYHFYMWVVKKFLPFIKLARLFW
jgi:hypothetical protein